MKAGLRDEALSFKRRQKPSVMPGPSRFISSITGSPSSQQDQLPDTSVRPAVPSAAGLRVVPPTDQSDMAHDWYAEGPGRRVGYEDLTAIDWIFEYTKERTRLRVLAATANGLIGYAQRLWDASQIWIILLLTGIAVGAIAAGINIASDWLSDLKLGFCSGNGNGAYFYLNKNFCCYGYDADSECDEWKTWGQAFDISATSGRWTIEYVFYLFIAVSLMASLKSLIR